VPAWGTNARRSLMCPTCPFHPQPRAKVHFGA
jgi:hypothetical protein